MFGIESIISMMQGTGCSPFFFTSALQSVIFGDKAREQQSELMDVNLDFKERMQQMRAEYARERIDSQKLFRRESSELGRRYMIQQTLAQNEARKQQIEFCDFLKHGYWPLNTDVYTYLEAQKDMMESKTMVPMNVLVASTELTSDMRDAEAYGMFCEAVADSLRPLTPGITIERCPWKARSRSKAADALNVNYIVSGIPTVLIFPYLAAKGCVGIETAAWSFARGPQSMSQVKLLKINGVEPGDMRKTALAGVRAAIGITRDLYMLAEYHLPVAYPSLISREDMAVPEIKAAMTKYYGEMAQLASMPEFSELCSAEERRAIEKSFIKSNLLNA